MTLTIERETIRIVVVEIDRDNVEALVQQGSATRVQIARAKLRVAA